MQALRVAKENEDELAATLAKRLQIADRLERGHVAHRGRHIDGSLTNQLGSRDRDHDRNSDEHRTDQPHGHRAVTRR